MKTKKQKAEHEPEAVESPATVAIPCSPRKTTRFPTFRRRRRIQFPRNQRMKQYFRDLVEDYRMHGQHCIFEEYRGRYTHSHNGGRMRVSDALFEAVYRIAIKEGVPLYLYDMDEIIERSNIM